MLTYSVKVDIQLKLSILHTSLAPKYGHFKKLSILHTSLAPKYGHFKNFEQLSNSAGVELRMYSEMPFDKRGVVILRNFTPDRAFGTYLKLFLGVKLA